MDQTEPRRTQPEPHQRPQKTAPAHDNGKAEWRPFPWVETDNPEAQRELPPFTL